MMNSISTIFTMDIYKMVKSGRSESHYVMVGRLTAVSAMIFAVIIAQPIFQNMESAFQTVQELTGYVAPGVVSVFLLGMFYKSANSSGAYAMLIASMFCLPQWHFSSLTFSL